MYTLSKPLKIMCKTNWYQQNNNHGRNIKRTKFEVQVVIPPPSRSLGIHLFPKNTYNGDQIEVEGKDYIVSSIVLKYKRQGGKYVRQKSQLNVQTTPMYFTIRHLDNLLLKKD